MPAITGQSSDPAIPGVLGDNPGQGDGVFGNGHETGRGVVGVSTQHTGVEGNSQQGTGLFGTSQDGEAVHAETHSNGVAAIAGFNLNPNGTGAAIFGHKEGQVGHAGFFDGNVHVTGQLTAGDKDILQQLATVLDDINSVKQDIDRIKRILNL